MPVQSSCHSRRCRNLHDNDCLLQKQSSLELLMHRHESGCSNRGSENCLVVVLAPSSREKLPKQRCAKHAFSSGVVIKRACHAQNVSYGVLCFTLLVITGFVDIICNTHRFLNSFFFIFCIMLKFLVQSPFPLSIVICVMYNSRLTSE